MSAYRTLVAHTLRRRRPLLLAVCLVLAAFQVFMILVARGLERSGAFQQLGSLMPDFIQQWTNMSGLSFRGLVSFGYSHPVVLLCLIATVVSIGTEPAVEVETRFVDLLLARPVPRVASVLRSATVIVLATGAAIGSMLAGTWVGLAALAPPSASVPPAAVVLALAANLGAVVIAWGGIAVAISSVSRRGSTAAAATGFLVFATFVLDYVGRFWEPAFGASRLSPFHYFSPFPLIGGLPLPLSDVAVLLGLAVVATGVAALAYASRDL